MHEGFMDVVSQSWNEVQHINPLMNIHVKLKNMRAILRRWNWEVFGNLRTKVSEAHKRLDVVERQMQEGGSRVSDRDLKQAHDDLRSCEDMLYTMLETKARLDWVKAEDRNVKMFHAAIKVRQANNKMRLVLEDGSVTEDNDTIGLKAVSFFERLFGECSVVPNVDLFDHITPAISVSENEILSKVPEEDEILRAVESMPQRSAPGPDGFSSIFFVKCWQIVRRDIIEGVKFFFQGGHIPRCVAASAITLIPKEKNASSLDQLRPIALGNFVHKIISKIMAERLKVILPRVISNEQSGFIQGRTIHDSLALAHDMVANINKKSRGGNVMLKIDMGKAYDRVSWVFILRMLRALGFSEQWCDLVYRNISNCWYSIRWGGNQYGWFKSHRGVRQGDPLSPSLFILVMEFLSRSLNQKMREGAIGKFYGRRGSLSFNHLLFADDLLIFCNGGKRSVQNALRCLHVFCSGSGQSINLQKSRVFISNKVSSDRRLSILDLTGFQEGNFPTQYLGAPLFPGKTKVSYFRPLLDKIKSRTCAWLKHFLSMAGRVTLIKSVLATIPIHCMALLPVPKIIIRRIESFMKDFLWNHGAANRRHWVGWDHICARESEGGLGLRSVSDVMQGLHCKAAWRVLSEDSLWARYARSRYQRDSKGAVVWNNLRPYIINLSLHCHWLLGRGDTSLSKFCFALGVQCMPNFQDMSIKEFSSNPNLWVSLLGINQSSHLPRLPNQDWSQDPDRLIWDLSKNGNVTVADIMEVWKPKNKWDPIFKSIWKGWIPRKISCFVWKVLKGVIPTDEVVQRIGISLASRCWCCSLPQRESLRHLLLESDLANNIWGFLNNLFCMPRFYSPSTLLKAWFVSRNQKSFLGCLGSSMAACGMWIIWKTRNRIKHGSTADNFIQQLRHWANRIGTLINKPHIDNLRSSIVCVSLGIAPPVSDFRHITWQAWRPSDRGFTLNVAILYRRAEVCVGAIIRDSLGAFVRGFRARWQVDVLEALNRLLGIVPLSNIHKIQVSHPSFLVLQYPERCPWRWLSIRHSILRSIGARPIAFISPAINSPSSALALSSGSDRVFSRMVDLPRPVKVGILLDSTPSPCLFPERLISSG